MFKVQETSSSELDCPPGFENAIHESEDWHPISHSLRNPTLVKSLPNVDKTSAHMENLIVTVETELHESIQHWLADYIGTSVMIEVNKFVSMREDNDLSEVSIVLVALHFQFG